MTDNNVSLSITDLFTPETNQEWMSQMLTNADTLQLQ